MGTKRSSWFWDMVRGAAVSVGASTVMGGLMVVASEVGLLGEPPPRKLTRKMLRRGGARALVKGKNLEAAAVLAHVGYGAAAGAVYGLIGRRLESRLARIAAGAAFGSAVWGSSYAGWVPAFNLMPDPEHDRPLRPPTMLVAHLVFGTVLGALFPRPRRRRWKAEKLPVRAQSEQLDDELGDSFPASDPPSLTQPRQHVPTDPPTSR